MYTDHITPPIDTNADRLDEILTARGITPEHVNKQDGDPQSPSSIIRWAVTDCRARIPRHYRDATPTEPRIRDWVDQLVASAGGRIVPAITTGPSLLLLGPTGVGKALHDSTELATPDGPRPIGAMQPGDSVFGGDGSPCRVVAVYPQGIRALWRLHLRDGRSVVCDSEHLWLATTRSDRGYGVPPKVISLAEMMRTGFTYADGSARWYLPTPGVVTYARTDLPIDAYTLGALIGDGGLTGGTASFTSADPEILASFRLPGGVTPRVRPRQRNSKALTWMLSGQRPHPNPLTVALRGLGLMGLRSSERFIPSSYLRASAEDRLALLCGLVDTDGYVRGTRISVSTSSHRLAEDIRQLVWSLGGHATARRKETTHLPSWTVQLSIPAELPCPARLPRKRGSWTPRQDGRGALIAVTRVERVPDGPATCIAVDSPDSTYLTADYVQTHNTYEAFGAIRDLAVTGVKAKWTAATAADIYAALRPRHLVDSETEFKRYADSALLVIDDLGAAKATEWTEEVNYRLINHRYEKELPTLITSNVPARELGQALGDRVASRLTEMCQRVVLKGDDRRRAAA